MSNMSIYKIALFNVPIKLRAALRFKAWVAMMLTHVQVILIRFELYRDKTVLEAYMTPQVCYIEKMLQLYISPQAVINPQPYHVIMYRDDETEEPDVFIDDTTGTMFHHEAEFGLNEFTVLLPSAAQTLEAYTRELLNKYKLLGTAYTIIYR